MSDHTELIVEALTHAKAARRVGAKDTADVCDRLADALEQTVKERDEARAELAEQRHVHGEEWAKEYAAARRAEAERDALADRIERARELVERDAQIEVHNEQVPIHTNGSQA